MDSVPSKIQGTLIVYITKLKLTIPRSPLWILEKNYQKISLRKLEKCLKFSQKNEGITHMAHTGKVKM